MNYKMLALDIDGTILNSQGQLSARTKTAITQAKERGIKVVLATGRRLTNTIALVEALGLTDLVVVHNGAVVYDPKLNQTVWQQGIELDLAQTILDKLEALSLNYIVYTGESAGERVVAPQEKWKEPEDLLTHYLGEDAEFTPSVVLDTPPVRISLIDHWEKVDPFYDEILNHHGEQVNAMLFGAERDTWRGIEILPVNANKRTGVAYVAERAGFSAAEVVAIGDNINDLEMVAWAGLGVAMENGAEVLKGQARRIAPSHNEDGVARIIEELFL